MQINRILVTVRSSKTCTNVKYVCVFETGIRKKRVQIITIAQKNRQIASAIKTALKINFYKENIIDKIFFK